MTLRCLHRVKLSRNICLQDSKESTKHTNPNNQLSTGFVLSEEGLPGKYSQHPNKFKTQVTAMDNNNNNGDQLKV